MLRPVTATFLPCLCATFRRLWSRNALDANVVTMILWRQPENWRSKLSVTLRSEGVKPGRSTFVESHRKASTPSFPSWPKRARSIMPSSAIASILKSPEKMSVPTGVLTAKATASAIEWFT